VLDAASAAARGEESLVLMADTMHRRACMMYHPWLQIQGRIGYRLMLSPAAEAAAVSELGVAFACDPRGRR